MTPEQIKEKLYENIHPEPNSGCWLWTGPVNYCGYGRLTIDKRIRIKAHRVSYAIFNGQTLDSFNHLNVCHKCDTPSCINPRHLFLGTQQDNLSDMREKRRQVRGHNHGMSKLNVDDVASVRKLLSEGRSHVSLARQFSVSRPTISLIAEGKTWR